MRLPLLSLLLLLGANATSTTLCSRRGVRLNGADLTEASRGSILLVAFMPLSCPHCHAQLHKLSSLVEQIADLRVAVLAPSNEPIDRVKRAQTDFPRLVLDRDMTGAWNSIEAHDHDQLIFDRCGRLSKMISHPKSDVTSNHDTINAIRSSLSHATCGWCQYDANRGGTVNSFAQKVQAYMARHSMTTTAPITQIQQPRSQHVPSGQRGSVQASHNAQTNQRPALDSKHHYYQQEILRQTQQQAAMRGYQTHQGYANQGSPQSGQAQRGQQQQQRPQYNQNQHIPAQTATNDYYRTQQQQQAEREQAERERVRHQQAAQHTVINQQRHPSPSPSVVSPHEMHRLQPVEGSYRIHYDNSASSSGTTGIAPTTAEPTTTRAPLFHADEDYDYGEDNVPAPMPTVAVPETQIPPPRQMDPLWPTLTPGAQAVQLGENNIPCSAYTDDICYHQQERLGREHASKCCDKGVYLTDLCVPGRCSNSTQQLCCMQKFMQSRYSCCADAAQAEGEGATNQFSRCCYEHFTEDSECCPFEAASDYWNSVADLCLPNTEIDFSTVRMEVRFTEGLKVVDLADTRLWKYNCLYGSGRIQYPFVP